MGNTWNEKFALIKRLVVRNPTRDFRLLLRGAYYFMKVNALRRPVCKYLDVSIGNECNMQCAHCFAASFKSTSVKLLTLEDYQKLAKDAYAMGCLHVNIQGGEPLVIKNLEKYIKIFTATGIYTSITTNGYALTEDWINRLKDCGVRKVIFSLDSMLPEEHDSFRKRKGAHAKVMDGIRLARKHDMAVGVNTTVTRDSLKSEGQKTLFDWLHAEKIPYNPIMACAVGAWGHMKELLVGDEDALHLEEMRKKFGLGHRDIHAAWFTTGCSAVAEQVYITPYGDVNPCPFIQVSLGNLKNSNLSDIWSKAMREGLYGRYNSRCWAAQEKSFVHDLQEISNRHETMPIPSEEKEGREFLAKHWHD